MGTWAPAALPTWMPRTAGRPVPCSLVARSPAPPPPLCPSPRPRALAPQPPCTGSDLFICWSLFVCEGFHRIFSPSLTPAAPLPAHCQVTSGMPMGLGTRHRLAVLTADGVLACSRGSPGLQGFLHHLTARPRAGPWSWGSSLPGWLGWPRLQACCFWSAEGWRDGAWAPGKWSLPRAWQARRCSSGPWRAELLPLA